MTPKQQELDSEEQTTKQQSLNTLETPVILTKRRPGGYLDVAMKMPENPHPEDNVSVRPTSDEVGKPNTDYPLARDHYTVKKLKKTRSWDHTNHRQTQIYKVFEISIDREQYPDEADRLENIKNQLARVPNLDSVLSSLETYEDLVEHQDLIREYEATCQMINSFWEDDSLASYAVERTARLFSIKQFPQGFYGIRSPHHGTVTKILDERLNESGFSGYSRSWGSFIVSDGDFDSVCEIVKPAYHLPGDEPILQKTTCEPQHDQEL